MNDRMRGRHSPSTGSRSWLPNAVVGAIIVAWTLLPAAFYHYTVDDTYILLRYARNISQGQGLGYNPGERVEGFTCPLWLGVLTLGQIAGVEAFLTAKIGGALLGALILVLVFRLFLREAPGAKTWGVAAVLLLALNASYALWSIQGLETMLACLLITLGYGSYRQERSEERTLFGSSFLFALAALCRPEAILLFLHTAVHLFLETRKPRRVRNVLCFGIGLAPYLAYLSFRLVHYGRLFPNTYYAKSSGMPFAGLLPGLHYTAGFAGKHFGLGLPGLIPAALAGVAVILFFVVPAARSGFSFYLAQSLLLWTLGVLYEGGDWMPLFRFYVPILPALILLFVLGMRKSASRGKNGRVLTLCFLGVLLAANAYQLVDARNGERGTLVTARGYENAHGSIARWLNERSAPGDAVALMDIGLIGYRTGLEVLDISGLTDSYIAHAPGPFLDKRYDPRYVLEKRPRFIVLVNGFPMDHRIQKAPGFSRTYCHRFTVNSQKEFPPPSQYDMYVYERCR